MLDSILIVGFLVLAGGAAAFYLRRRQKREARGREAMAKAMEANLHLPQSLHPVIDTDLCIGSLACLKVCPEGEILGVVDGKAQLINGAACIGHGRCAVECPVGAIKLVFGTAERGQDLPEVDEAFESSRPGVYIVGELGGMGLLKNAINQGLQAAEAIGEVLKGSDPEGDAVDVVVVGGGPAGLATALGLKKEGLTFRVLEQESLGGTIAHYPRQKVVMTERVELPFYGKFGKKLISKEELLEAWQEVLASAQVEIETGVKVLGIDGIDGAFSVQTGKGPVAARKVVLATGRRGSPRKLGAAGEELEKVSYRLIDPNQYDDAKVLVVGGGDSALEAAIQLAQESSAEVTLSYRNAELGRCREANKQKFRELVQAGQIHALMPSTVVEIGPQEVVIESNGQQASLDNDYVLVCIGGELPVEFLNKAKVGMRRFYGTAPGMGASRTSQLNIKRGSAKELAEKRKHQRLVVALWVLGVIIVLALMAVGRDYYLLEKAQRVEHPAHAFLKPAGVWGHGVGIVATLVMMSNFLYAARKRWDILRNAGRIRGWLTFHQFVGFMSPLVIAFHAAFQSNNILASATATFLGIVVGTGIVGRFFYGLVPSSNGSLLELSQVVGRWERFRSRIEPLLSEASDVEAVRRVLGRANAPVEGQSLLAHLVGLPARALAHARSLARVKPLFPSSEHYDDFKAAFYRLNRLHDQVAFYKGLKRLMAGWRVFHVSLAIALVFLIAAHIGVSLFLGYRWIFK